MKMVLACTPSCLAAWLAALSNPALSIPSQLTPCPLHAPCPVDGGGGEEDLDKEAVREAEAQAEFERARERLTLKHRNTSQWARRALKRGIQVMDEGTKEAIAEQLRLGQELRKKIEGRGSGSEGGDSGDETR